MNNRCCLVITTTNNKKVARLISEKLVQNGVIACAQLDEIESFFDGKWVSEFRLFIKAKSSEYNVIEALILKFHNYQLPQIVRVGIDGGYEEYLNWISNSNN